VGMGYSYAVEVGFCDLGGWFLFRQKLRFVDLNGSIGAMSVSQCVIVNDAIALGDVYGDRVSAA